MRFVKVLVLSVVGGTCDDGAPVGTAADGMSSVRAGLGGSNLEGFLCSVGASAGRGDDMIEENIFGDGLGGTKLRGREIAKPMVFRSMLGDRTGGPG